jgi:hypothetical protein
MMAFATNGVAMGIELNWVQRGVLLVAGLLLLLFAMNEWDGYGSDQWLATALFVLAVLSFVLAAKPKGKKDG